MSVPDISTVAPNGVVNLSDSPVSLDDATFDSLFPAEPTPQVSAPQVQPNSQPGNTTVQPIVPNPSQPQPQSAPVAQPTAQPQPFLRGDKTVYNTAEAAVQGINQKDALIEQLRQRYALTTGFDPITQQPVGMTPQPQVPADYYSNPSLYATDLYNAAKNIDKNPEGYRDVQAKFFLDTLKPLQPLMQRMAREQALESVSTEIPEVKTFVGTPTYNKALDTNPELKNAIDVAETDYKWHHRLPSLYKLAYLAGQGLQLPEILQAQKTSQTTQPAAPAVQTQPRPTAQPTTPALPTATARPTFKTIEGIRDIIRDSESRGMTLDF